MKEYSIWLSDSPGFEDYLEGNPNLPRTMKGKVMAKNLNQAYMMSQGGIGAGWENRSCSISDVIEESGKFHLVMSIGFQEISEPFPGYQKI